MDLAHPIFMLGHQQGKPITTCLLERSLGQGHTADMPAQKAEPMLRFGVVTFQGGWQLSPQCARG